mmetsp:Transcript_12029/g.16477  ORF Transcript_12029/g.16477 Transcript_12029/m.16477 type:complete len:524 (+) Transcript_12029:15-1586(+)
MDILITVENFEETSASSEKYREINSPRSLEACLRSGLDPAELYPKSKNAYLRMNKSTRASSPMTAEMMDIKYESFNKKRADKIEIVKKERAKIIQYAERKLFGTTNLAQSMPGSPHQTGILDDKRAASAMLEMEEKRMEALRRRQEKEMSKIIEREQNMAALQMKIKRSEEEEIKKKKAHDKKVAEQKLAEEKKRAQMEQEQKRLEAEEAEAKRQLARKEAEVEEKIKKNKLMLERQIAKEARIRDEERKQKIEEYKKKTEALIKSQEDMAEENKKKMLERESRIMNQLAEKKELKRQEVLESREKASKRIEEALQKHHELHEQKKMEFNQRKKDALQRAKENEIAEREKFKKQAEDREKRNATRIGRLIDAYKRRKDHREEIVQRRNEKDKVYDRIRDEKDAQMSMQKFQTELKLQDKLDNVERVARMNEFRRLQTLQKVHAQDMVYEQIQSKKMELMRRHNEEAKHSLIRKHEIGDAMEKMRMTNDFTLLDKLFDSKKSKRDKKEDKHDTEAEDPRLVQTV